MSLPPQRRRIVAAPARRTQLQSVRVVIEEDAEPDASYLEQDGFEDRLASLENEEWHFIHLRAEADILVNDVTQTLTSAGLGGIESDTDEEALREMIVEEWTTLRSILKTVGVPTEQLPLAVDRAWVEWRT